MNDLAMLEACARLRNSLNEMERILRDDGMTSAEALAGWTRTQRPTDVIADLRRTSAVLRAQADETHVVAHEIQADGIDRAIEIVEPEIARLRGALASAQDTAAEFARERDEMASVARAASAALEASREATAKAITLAADTRRRERLALGKIFAASRSVLEDSTDAWQRGKAAGFRRAEEIVSEEPQSFDDERARIVRMLRKVAEASSSDTWTEALTHAADAIENLDHMQGPTA